jgi:hypothetical protein
VISPTQKNGRHFSDCYTQEGTERHFLVVFFGCSDVSIFQ